MSIPMNVKDNCRLMLAIVEELSASKSVALDVAIYWTSRLNETIEGTKDWAQNPAGYVLKWMQPSAKRVAKLGLSKSETALELFAMALRHGQTSKLDVWARRICPALIESGLYRSLARSDSAYGAVETRLIGNKVSLNETLESGNKAIAANALEESAQAKTKLEQVAGKMRALAILARYGKVQSPIDVLTTIPETVDVPETKPVSRKTRISKK